MCISSNNQGENADFLQNAYKPEFIWSTANHFITHADPSREQQSLMEAGLFSHNVRHRKGAEDLKLTQVGLLSIR